MFELPNIVYNDIARIADWVELSTLCLNDPCVSQAQVDDILTQTGMRGNEKGDAYKEDEEDEAEPLFFSSDDEISSFTEEVWRTLRTRQRHNGYPFVVRRKTIHRLAETWREAPAFTMLLLSDIGQHYDSVRDTKPSSDGVSGRYFEHIVAAAAEGLFGGPSERFGWPINPEWPKKIDDRIARLGDLLNLEIENLDGKTNPADKDRTLDVATLFSIAGSSDALPRYLVQCAVGTNWKEKRGEPTIAQWKDLLQWKGPLHRAIAIPWRLDEKFDYDRARRHFDDAIILDRERLVAGFPDKRLSESIGAEIAAWCSKVLARIEVLPPS